jgi:15-cis-phytoene synthase
MVPLEQSRSHCRNVARTRARNFYYSFLLLDRERRDAMCAVYAFNRACDDLSDEPGATRAGLDRWRRELDNALGGDYGPDPLWPAFHAAAIDYRIPAEYFHEMIEGVASDLEPRTIATFAELYAYCYQVASVVGMTVIRIFGFESPDALPLAEKCGIAFQLTNILRDVREDAGRGRVYLPAEDLRRYGVDPATLREGPETAEFRELMRFECGRARGYYRESSPLLELVAPASRASLGALIEIYSRLLDKIESSGYNVLERRIALPTLEKLWVLARTAACRRFATARPDTAGTYSKG